MWVALLLASIAQDAAPVEGRASGYSCIISRPTPRGRVSMWWHLEADGRPRDNGGGHWMSNWEGEVLLGINWRGTAPDPLTPATTASVIPLHVTGREMPPGRYRHELHVVGSQGSSYGLSFASNWQPVTGDMMVVSWGNLYAFARGAGQIEVRTVMQQDHRVVSTARFGLDLVEEGRSGVLAGQAEMLAKVRDFRSRCTRHVAGPDGETVAISPRP